ncbi:ketoacyl-synthetase C-terminal extension domain-containing protein [Micromonospora sp. BRA006-A]|nr:ketoacyl-synthetase C-terminal extension domain-containing protein [Micromonospora sp. BRA006-A]
MGRPRRAAVSSFGISGTNAHVIIEQPPAETIEGEVVVRDVPPVVPVLLSARDAAALSAQAARWARWLTADEAPRPLDVAWSSVTTPGPRWNTGRSSPPPTGTTWSRR